VTNRTQAAVWGQSRQFENQNSVHHHDPSCLNVG
jgi:hypothetical protein